MAENIAYKTNSSCWPHNNYQNNVSKYGYRLNKSAKNTLKKYDINYWFRVNWKNSANKNE